MKELVNTSRYLLKEGFLPIHIVGETGNIDHNTHAAAFKKSVAGINYYIFLIDANKEYKGIYNFLLQKNVSGKDNVVVGVFFGEQTEELSAFTQVDFDAEAPIADVRWIADTKDKTIKTHPNTPTRVQGTEEAVRLGLNANEDGSLEASSFREIYSSREKENIKSKKVYLTYIIIAINAVMLLVTGFFPTTEKLLACGALCGENVSEGEVYRLVTHVFLHSGLLHFAANSIGLYILGTRAEMFFGRVKYVLYYLFTGILAGATSLAFSAPGTVSVGASGAICGIMGALFVFSLVKRVTVRGLDSFALALYVAVSLASGFLTEHVDNFAHFGGFISGAVIELIVRKVRDK